MRLEEWGATVRGVRTDSILCWVRRHVGSALLRRFVWPVAEYLEANRPVKEPFTLPLRVLDRSFQRTLRLTVLRPRGCRPNALVTRGIFVCRMSGPFPSETWRRSRRLRCSTHVVPRSASACTLPTPH